MSPTKWNLTTEEEQELVTAMTEELIPLRVRAGISQEELGRMIGVSRQTVSAIESRRKIMTWQTYLSLIFYFDTNLVTREALRRTRAYPEALIRRINGGKNPDASFGKEAGELAEFLKGLDEQGLHTVKTVLLVEYARSKKIPGDIVVRAFEGSDVINAFKDAAAEAALENIRSRSL